MVEGRRDSGGRGEWKKKDTECGSKENEVERGKGARGKGVKVMEEEAQEE